MARERLALTSLSFPSSRYRGTNQPSPNLVEVGLCFRISASSREAAGVFSGTRRWWLVGGLAAVVLAGAAWLWWSSRPAPRARQYLTFTACLLTDGQGVRGAAAPVWAGMQDASLQTRAKVEFLPVVGESTTANALPYLAGLVQRHCDVILAAGPAQVDAVRADASRYPRIRFVVVGAELSGPNVVSVNMSSPDGVRRQVAETVAEAVKNGTGR